MRQMECMHFVGGSGWLEVEQVVFLIPFEVGPCAFCWVESTTTTFKQPIPKV